MQKHKQMKPSDLIATFEAGTLLTAFFLETSKVIKSDGLSHAWPHRFGTLAAGYSSWLKGFVLFVILEACKQPRLYLAY